MRRPSLARRLLASSVLGLAVLLPAGGLALSWAFRRPAEAAFDERLDAWSEAVIAGLEVDAAGRIAVRREAGDPRFERPLSGWYWEIRDGAERIAASRSLWDGELSVEEPAAAEPRIVRAAGPRGQALRAQQRRFALPGAANPLELIVAGDEGELRRELARFHTLLLVSFGALGLGALALGALQARLVMRPVRALVAELEGVRAGAAASVGSAAPRELAPLTDSLNALLAHDAAIVRRARDRAADLAHALKTPLTLIRAEAEELGDDSGKRIVAHADTMDRHLARRLAGSAALPAVASERTPVAPVLRALADTLRRLHPGRTIALEVPEGLAFRGAREDLEEIAGNLLENACKWARSRVEVRAGGAQGRLLLTVDDDGPGLPPDQRDRAVARGGRLDESEPGWGLGLAIVEEVLAIHGGSLRLGDAALGGLRAAVELPAAASAVDPV